MIKKLAAGVCCAAIAMLAAAGCSNSDDQTNAYAKKVCDKVPSQQAAIQKANASISDIAKENAPPKDVQQTDAAAFGQLSGAYRTLAKAIQDAGAPPVDKGEQLQKNAVNQLNAISASYTKLQKSVQGLNTSDQGKFADGLKALTNQYMPLLKNTNDSLTKLQAGDIGKAMAQQPGCRQAGASASPAGA